MHVYLAHCVFTYDPRWPGRFRFTSLRAFFGFLSVLVGSLQFESLAYTLLTLSHYDLVTQYTLFFIDMISVCLN